MNVLQYLVIVMTGFAIIGTPYLLVLSVRRKQKMRVFDIIMCDLVMVYAALDIVFPSVLASAPRLVHWLVFIVLLLQFTNAGGLLRRFFISRKASPIERRQS